MRRKQSYGGILRNIITYRHNSILIRNFGLVVLMMFLPLLIITMMVKTNMEKVVEQEIHDANDSSLYTTAQTLDTILDKMYSFSYYLSSGNDFTLLYLYQLEEVLEEYGDIYEKQVRLNMLIEEYVDSVYIYLEPYDTVLYSDKAQSTFKMSKVSLEDMEDLSWLPYYETCKERNDYVLGARIKEELYPYLMTMVVPVKAGLSSPRGGIVVNVDMRKLSKYLGYREQTDQRFYMVGEQGELYYTNQEDLIEKGSGAPEYLDFVWQEDIPLTAVIEGKNYIVSVMENGTFGCRYVLCTPAERYESRMDQVNDFVRNMILLTLLLGILVAYIVTIHSFAPIQKIMNEINRPEEPGEEGKEPTEEDSRENDNEIRYITGMVREAKLRNKRYHMETGNWMKKLSNAQMVALQSQINPHYLYNTLDMINWRSVELLGYHNELSDMITTLGNFFRIGLQRTSYLIQVREELEHAKLYARILEVRYGGSIRVEWDIEEEILSYKIIRLTMQPLIENAINHGLRPKRYEGNIRVRGGQMDDILYLSVEDDGVGMEEEDCVAMNHELIDHYETDSEHVGIRNVNQRIKILFGDEYGVNLRRNEKGGLNVRMILLKKM